jgi:hypothetical protein
VRAIAGADAKQKVTIMLAKSLIWLCTTIPNHVDVVEGLLILRREMAAAVGGEISEKVGKNV